MRIISGEWFGLHDCSARKFIEEAGQGHIALGDKGFTAISIEDTASVLAEVVDKPSTFKRVIAINPGNTPIEKIFD